MSQLTSINGKAVNGKITVPGDKSISHRALMLSSLAVGSSTISNMLEGEDVLATAQALQQMGARITRIGEQQWQVNGVGVGGLLPPADRLVMGNSGTSARLLMGLVATHGFPATFTGDASLSKRPMERVITPLNKMGAKFRGNNEDRLPLTVIGTNLPQPITYETPIASAQIKSAILFAGLNSRGATTVIEKVATRDHSERMLKGLGADIVSEITPDGLNKVTIKGQTELKPQNINVPGDISSAAFPMTLAAMSEGADLTLTNVGFNPLRIGIVHALRSMGADITIDKERLEGFEPVANIHVRGQNLKATTDIRCDPSIMIDEFPILFVAAAVAEGKSRFTGLQELRVKESDRLAVMASNLEACGVPVTLFDDGIEIDGLGGEIPGGAVINSHMDHRIAMSFAILGQAAKNPITIDDARPINTSFPGFSELMTGIGCRFILGS